MKVMAGNEAHEEISYCDLAVWWVTEDETRELDDDRSVFAGEVEEKEEWKGDAARGLLDV
jgi:hypothetical protein